MAENSWQDAFEIFIKQLSFIAIVVVFSLLVLNFYLSALIGIFDWIIPFGLFSTVIIALLLFLRSSNWQQPVDKDLVRRQPTANQIYQYRKQVDVLHEESSRFGELYVPLSLQIELAEKESKLLDLERNLIHNSSKQYKFSIANFQMNDEQERLVTIFAIISTLLISTLGFITSFVVDQIFDSMFISQGIHFGIIPVLITIFGGLAVVVALLGFYYKKQKKSKQRLITQILINQKIVSEQASIITASVREDH